MKTSNKLLVVATVILLGYLVIYNLGLKAEYAKGEFKSRFYKMTKANIKDFNAIQNNLGNMFGIAVEYGPEYGVWVKDEMNETIRFSKTGKTLVIDFKTKQEDYHYGGNMVIITCPVLDSVTTVKKANQYVRTYAGTSILGFNLRALKLNVGYFTKVELKNNTIGQLDAFVEGLNGDLEIGDGLIISKHNNINILNLKTSKGTTRSEIRLDDPTIGKANFDLSDSTSLTISGKLLQGLRR